MLNLYKLKNNPDERDPKLMEKEKAQKKGNFGKYVQPDKEALSTKKLKWGLWYARHKVLFYKLLIIFLTLFIVVIFIFSAWRWIYFFLEMPDQKLLEQNLASSINYTGAHPHFKAQQIQIIGARVFNSGVDKYDAAVEATNPNKSFLVSFDYYFTINGSKTQVKKTFLLPGENRPIVVLGIDSSTHPGQPTFSMENVKWKRISGHEIKDVISWQKYRLDFETSDFKFIRRASSISEDGANAHAIKFKITNKSPYNYKEPKFLVGLYQGSSLAALLPLQLDSLKSLETREVDLRSFVSHLTINGAVVFPLINPYDEEVYK